MENREILFRGKRVDGKWIEGQFYRSDDKAWITDSKNINLNTYNNIAWFEVIPETVGQFTGLKDKNGNSIFEGDNLRAQGFGNTVVFFNKKVSAFQFQYNSVNNVIMSATLYHFQEHEYEITGNIHEK